jgi:hypothetical protein
MKGREIRGREIREGRGAMEDRVMERGGRVKESGGEDKEGIGQEICLPPNVPDRSMPLIT